MVTHRKMGAITSDIALILIFSAISLVIAPIFQCDIKVAEKCKISTWLTKCAPDTEFINICYCIDILDTGI